MNEVVFTSVSKEGVKRTSKYSGFTIGGHAKSGKGVAIKPFVRLRGVDKLEEFSGPDSDDFDELLGKYIDDIDDTDDIGDIVSGIATIDNGEVDILRSFFTFMKDNKPK